MARNNKELATYSLKEYLIVYNCIGWALGIRDWINPSTEKCNYSANNYLNCIEILTKNFLNVISIKYNSSSKKNTFVQENIIFKSNQTVHCFEEIPNINLIHHEGVVTFYFKNGVMTHASRFVYELEGHILNSSVSKLGHDIMVTHKLEDLAGSDSLYGDPLCYLLPLSQGNNCVMNAVEECINENQIIEV